MVGREMRILIYTSSFLPNVGGAEVVVHNLAEGLIENGHQVLVATFHQGAPDPKRNYELRRLYVSPKFNQFRLATVARRTTLLACVRRWKPDVVHVHFSLPCGYDMKKMSSFARVPWVLTCHGEDIQKRPEIPCGLRLDPRAERKIGEAVREADGIIAISRSVREEYLSLGADADKIFNAPNPIPYAALLKSNFNARRQIGLSSDIPVVLAVGRNHPKKGFRRLLDVAAHLRRRGANMQFVFVGQGCVSLIAHAEELGIGDLVHAFEAATPAGLSFEEHTEQESDTIETYFQAADIFAMPSLVESFGLVTVEAMAAGLPVVAFEGPGTNDFSLERNRLGALVANGDIVRFADWLEKYSEDQTLRQDTGDRGRKYAARYDRQVIARQHVDLYKKVSGTE